MKLKPIPTAVKLGLLSLATVSFAYAQEGSLNPDTADAKQSENIDTLPRITIKDKKEREEADGPLVGYTANRSSSSTKLDTPIIETPQSISVIGRKELSDRAIFNMTEAARYTVGVMTEPYGYDTTGYLWYHLRGFNDSYQFLFVDGLKSPGGSYSVPAVNSDSAERIEIIRGPSSSLYGQGTAGGLVNVIRKQPAIGQERTAELVAGNFTNHLNLDTGGSIDKDNKVIWRINASLQRERSMIKYPSWDRSNTKKSFLEPTLSIKAGSNTNIVVGANIHNARGTTNPAEYLAPDKASSTGFLGGTPRHDHLNKHQSEFYYFVDHEIDDNLKFKHKLRTVNVRTDFDYTISDDEVEESTTHIEENATSRREAFRYTAMDNQVHGDFSTGKLRHRFVFGLDALTVGNPSRIYTSTGPTLDLLLPPSGQYQQYVADPALDESNISAHSKSSVRQVGVYFHDELKFNDYVLNIGTRFDSVKSTENDKIDQKAEKQNDKKLSSRLGILKTWNNQISSYASYSESFLPTIGRDSQGNQFKPTRGKQFEIGLKYKPFQSDTIFTAAIFDLRKTNVSTTDPDDTSFLRQTGEVRSRGIELEAKTEILKNMSLISSVAYNDVKVVKSNDDDLGKHPVGVPKIMASAWLDYRFERKVSGLSAGIGLRYMGKTYANLDNTVATPAYTLYDAAIRYKTGPWEFSLNSNNLFNRKYVASYAYGYYLGQPRTVIARARYTF